MIYGLPEIGWEKQTGLASRSIGNQAFLLECLKNAVKSVKIGMCDMQIGFAVKLVFIDGSHAPAW